MEITSLIFVVFVAITLVIYYIIPKKCQWIVLLIASLAFFIASSAWLTLLMIVTTLIIYFGALAIQKQKDLFAVKKKELGKSERKALKEQIKKKQKTILTIVVVVVVAILALTKYCNFLGGIVNGVTGIFKIGTIVPVFDIVLPLGISYYTLMSISYIVDVNRGVIAAEKNPFRLLLFVCYFPHIVEGPFDRYKALDEQFKTPHKFDYDQFVSAVILVLWGFFKKLVIADRLGGYVSDYFNNVTESSLIGLGLATLMFTFQLYMDFSGCIDIISGISELFGIKVAENFRQPFFSKSIDEFWRRWHISLGAWLKEYVFYPVSLSKPFKKLSKSTKKIKSKHIADLIPLAYALFFVWFCNGLWHGTSVKYIVYGLYYYVLMMLGKLCEPLFDKTSKALKINRQGKAFGLFQMLRTFVIVNIGMLLFKVDTLSKFFVYIKDSVFNIKSYDVGYIVPGILDILIILTGLIVVFMVSILKERKCGFIKDLNDIKSLRMFIIVFLTLSVIIFGAYGVEYLDVGAIYAQF